MSPSGSQRTANGRPTGSQWAGLGQRDAYSSDDRLSSCPFSCPWDIKTPLSRRLDPKFLRGRGAFVNQGENRVQRASGSFAGAFVTAATDRDRKASSGFGSCSRRFATDTRDLRAMDTWLGAPLRGAAPGWRARGHLPKIAGSTLSPGASAHPGCGWATSRRHPEDRQKTDEPVHPDSVHPGPADGARGHLPLRAGNERPCRFLRHGRVASWLRSASTRAGPGTWQKAQRPSSRPSAGLGPFLPASFCRRACALAPMGLRHPGRVKDCDKPPARALFLLAGSWRGAPQDRFGPLRPTGRDQKGESQYEVPKSQYEVPMRTENSVMRFVWGR